MSVSVSDNKYGLRALTLTLTLTHNADLEAYRELAHLESEGALVDLRRTGAQLTGASEDRGNDTHARHTLPHDTHTTHTQAHIDTQHKHTLPQIITRA